MFGSAWFCYQNVWFYYHKWVSYATLVTLWDPIELLLGTVWGLVGSLWAWFKLHLGACFVIVRTPSPRSTRTNGNLHTQRHDPCIFGFAKCGFAGRESGNIVNISDQCDQQWQWQRSRGNNCLTSWLGSKIKRVLGFRSGTIRCVSAYGLATKVRNNRCAMKPSLEKLFWGLVYLYISGCLLVDSLTSATAPSWNQPDGQTDKLKHLNSGKIGRAPVSTSSSTDH